MILKASQRGGGKQLAVHLLKTDENEHVEVHDIRGFVADDVTGAFQEAHAISKATKCRQFLFSLSLNPPETENVPIETFESAIADVEKSLGLTDQPRVIVFHEKEGRRHAHCVWSRIDIDEMKAVQMSYFKRKLNDIAKNLYLDNDWTLPNGFIDKHQTNPLNFSRAEWQKAKRTRQNPKHIKQALQECWTASDSKSAFENALMEKGYFLARGSNSRFVAMDVHGEVYSLSRQLGVKIKELKSKLGEQKDLQSIEGAKQKIGGQLATLFKNHGDDINLKHDKLLRPIMREKQKMASQHKSRRSELNIQQQDRWQSEEIARSERLRKGFKGLWDRLTGTYQRARKKNEEEVLEKQKRDLAEKELLIFTQLNERRQLQLKLVELRDLNHEEKSQLYKNIKVQNEQLGNQDSLKNLLNQLREDKNHSRGLEKYSPDRNKDEPDFSI
ncbi:MAG: relaxase [Alteromonadaceae bacterium]|nr:relaxase [Alteromonadaceae bacterium]